VTKKDIHAMFPGLQARPRPEPNLSVKDNHDAWLQEYHHWGALKCPCGRGYFCRAHGSWISGEEVGSGAAVASDEQQQGSCPAYHYGGRRPLQPNAKVTTDISLPQTTAASRAISVSEMHLLPRPTQP